MQAMLASGLTIVLRVGVPLLVLAALVGLAMLWARRRTSYEGGELVGSGFYWGLRTLGLVLITESTGILPGKPGQRYIRLPAPLAPFVGLLLGLLYVIFLPAIALGFCGWLIIKYGLAALRRPARTTGRRSPTRPL